MKGGVQNILAGTSPGTKIAVHHLPAQLSFPNQMESCCPVNLVTKELLSVGSILSCDYGSFEEIFFLFIEK